MPSSKPPPFSNSPVEPTDNPDAAQIDSNAVLELLIASFRTGEHAARLDATGQPADQGIHVNNDEIIQLLTPLIRQRSRQDKPVGPSRQGEDRIKDEPDDHEAYYGLLPASSRDKNDKDKIVDPRWQVDEFLKKELDLARPDDLRKWMWIVGRRMPPRPLHHQLLMSRELFLTEQMDLHLVWKKGEIYLKPIPRFLLEPGFWAKYLSCEDNCTCTPGHDAGSTGGQYAPCDRKRLWGSALGFLFSYTALIANESDFAIAKDKNLLPAEVKWTRWRAFVREILKQEEDICTIIDHRFTYGELRLDRLNKIYWLTQPGVFSYMSHWNQYSAFFEDNFSLLASSTVYIAVVLTAMQLGLATNQLKDNATFHSASYGFTVFSFVGLLAFAIYVFATFLYIFVNNLVATRIHKKKRQNDINEARRQHSRP